uniref:Cytochrome c oxidase subunit 2 n=1 Tax=Hydra sinensis TaxID=570418 RepID=R4IXA9_9CNID|nr:cytochrome c oxidase subunit II [Hydra sinensis]AGE65897.1 cytochrome c oxidase subunit II [Hydra sinensis]
MKNFICMIIFFICLLLNINLIYKDIPEFNQFSFQDTASFNGNNLVFFHDQIMFYIIIILVLVGWLLFSVIRNNYFYKFLLENNFIEVIWTSIPAIILVLIATPSLYLLYSIDENIEPSLTIKVVGHQWYWSYEYSNFLLDVEFDSYMIPTIDLNNGDFRLLETDNDAVVPAYVGITVIVPSADVIHCWTVPSLGIKIYATPYNKTCYRRYNRPGKFFGQCSELCGLNHSFMPISINSVSQEKFINWIINKH